MLRQNTKTGETLWNAVEKVQNKSNSRYARMLEMALPNELSTKEQIELARNYIKENFVDKGMAADFALHKKDGNNHIHVMTTVRGFTKTGYWASMEKKDYARDENGNRIPVIDPKTGEQKRGKKNDLLWKRVNVVRNGWNSKKQLLEWRKNWADECNKYLPENKHIDHRSYMEQGIDKIPTIHEGYAERQMSAKGLLSDRVKTNEEIKHQNRVIEKIKKMIADVTDKIQAIKEKLVKERDTNGKNVERKNGFNGAVSESDYGTTDTDRGIESGIQKRNGVGESVGGTAYNIEDAEQRIAKLMRKVTETEQSIKRIKDELIRRSKDINERINKYRRNASDNGDAGSEDNRIKTVTVTGKESVGYAKSETGKTSGGKPGYDATDTDDFIRKIEAEIESSGIDRQNRDREQSRSDIEEKRKVRSR